MPNRKRIAVLISGRGSNMRALIEAARAADYPAEIALVLSSRTDAPGLEYARDAGVPTMVVERKAFASREASELAMQEALRNAHVDLVALAGYMHIMTAGFVARWDGCMLNIHPSLLPSFKGLAPQQQALDAGVMMSGCTVHFVTPELDSGPIVAQAAVPVLANDTAASLEQRILAAEHKLYPRALALVASGAARLVGGRVVYAGTPKAPADAIWSPQ